MYAAMVIYHAGGERFLPSYRVRTVEGRFASRPELHRGSGSIVVYGDRKANPTPFTAEAWVEHPDGLEAAYALAYSIVTEAESASWVRTHWHDVPVSGILGFRMIPDVLAVRLTLEFAPTSPAVQPLALVTADLTTITADSTSVTADIIYDPPGGI